MQRTGERVLGQGRWLTLRELTYRTADGHDLRWECLERVNRPPGIVCIATLRPSGRCVLIRQYRLGLERTVTGFPAGLVEQGDPAAAAVCELREETGYHGTVRMVSPPVVTGAGISNELMHVALLDVDETDPANRDPHPALAADEQIATVLVAETELPAFFAAETARGHLLAAGAWYWFTARAVANGA